MGVRQEDDVIVIEKIEKFATKIHVFLCDSCGRELRFHVSHAKEFKDCEPKCLEIGRESLRWTTIGLEQETLTSHEFKDKLMTQRFEMCLQCTDKFVVKNFLFDVINARIKKIPNLLQAPAKDLQAVKQEYISFPKNKAGVFERIKTAIKKLFQS